MKNVAQKKSARTHTTIDAPIPLRPVEAERSPISSWAKGGVRTRLSRLKSIANVAKEAALCEALHSIGLSASDLADVFGFVHDEIAEVEDALDHDEYIAARSVAS